MICIYMSTSQKALYQLQASSQVLSRIWQDLGFPLEVGLEGNTVFESSVQAFTICPPFHLFQGHLFYYRSKEAPNQTKLLFKLLICTSLTCF